MPLDRITRCLAQHTDDDLAELSAEIDNLRRRLAYHEQLLGVMLAAHELTATASRPATAAPLPPARPEPAEAPPPPQAPAPKATTNARAPAAGAKHPDHAGTLDAHKRLLAAIAEGGPQPSNALAVAVGLTANMATRVLTRSPWFERESDGWHLSEHGRAAWNALREEREEAA